MDLLTELLGGKLLWLGSSGSLMSISTALAPERFETMLAQAAISRSVSVASYKASNGSDEEDPYEDNSVGYEVVNGVAVLSINGALVNSDKWYLKYLGLVGYPHISDRLIQAYEDEEVSTILLNIKSPGGAVSGIAEVGELMDQVQKVKSINTYSADMMCSGGYWLGCQGSTITVGEMSQTGSIGVIMTHIEYSKMMEENGVTATVLREGKYKALMTPYEPLTEEARAEAQKDMRFINNAFETRVAAKRGMSQETLHDQAGQGRVFWGRQAVAVGLADAVGTSSDALAHSIQIAQNPERKYFATAESDEMKLKALKDRAQISANGADLEVRAPETDPAPAVTEKDPKDDAQPKAEAAPEANTPDISALVDKVADLSVKLASAEAARVTAEKERDELVSVSVGLAEIAANSLSTMSVALGGAKVSADDMELSDLLAKHQEVSAAYVSKFPVGGVGAVEVDTEKQGDKKAVVTPDYRAAIAATQRQSANA